MITVKVRDAVGRTVLMSLLIFANSNFIVFGQENSQKKSQESPIGRWILGEKSKQEETPKPTPESTKDPTRERKVEESNRLSIPQNPPNYSPEYYPAPPTVDYMQEAERIKRQMESDTRRQDADAQQQIEEFRRQQEASDKQFQDWLLQQQQNQTGTTAERQSQQGLQNQTDQQLIRPPISVLKPTEQEAAEAKKQADVAAKNAAEQRRWMWLIPLFELIQVIILALIAYRKRIAQKSSIAMVASLIGCALGLGILTLYDPFTVPGVLAGIVGMICFNVFFFSKTSSYIIVLLSQESLSNKLLSVFSVGLAL